MALFLLIFKIQFIVNKVTHFGLGSIIIKYYYMLVATVVKFNGILIISLQQVIFFAYSNCCNILARCCACLGREVGTRR